VKSGKYVVGAVVAVAAISAAWLIYYRFSQLPRATATYRWRIEYAEFPADDLALGDWLRSQEGVGVTTLRREGKALELTYTRVQAAQITSPQGCQVLANAQDAQPRLQNRLCFKFLDGFTA
jgi:hypothetical protein